ncbi:MAG: hypothetical protein E7640_05630, partial [Ruminococcaceae bacterium]|nr:hypothetical protein [Oscillospiraceae bacterium]
MKKKLSLILTVITVVAVFTLIFAAMALPASAATEAGDDDVVVTVYWHTEDNFAAVPAENSIAIKKSEMLTKLLADSNDNVTKSKAEAGNYIWLVFKADTQISLERNGQGIGFYVAKDKKAYLEGNGSVYNFNTAAYDNGSNATVIKGAGTGTNPGDVIISDFTINSRNDAALNFANCTVELNNVVLNSSSHKGINVTAGNAKVVLDGVSTVYGGQHTMQVTSSNQLEVTGPFNGNLFTLSVSGDAGKATLNGVTLNGRLNVSYLKGTVEIKDTTITSYSAVSCTQKDSGPREIIISGSSVISSDADTNVVTIPAGVTVTLRDSAIIRSTMASSYPAAVSNSGTLNVEGGRIEASRFAVRMYASSTTNISGGTVTSPCDGLLRFEGDGVTLNVSGGTVENTATDKCIVNVNGKNDATVNLTGGRLEADGVCIYANGGTNLAISVSGNAVIATAAGKDAIRRIGADSTGSFAMSGGSITGVLNFGTTNTTFNISGGSLTQSTTLDLTTLGGTLENFSNLELTGSLKASQGTLTAGGTKVTLAASKITLAGGSISAISIGSGNAIELKDLACTAPMLANGDLTLDNTILTPAEGNHAIEFLGGTLTIRNGSQITSSGSGFTIRIEKEGAIVNIESGSTVMSAKDSHIRFERANVTLNISGAGTRVENTATGCVINTNENNGATLNITDGATVKSGGVCIYANGGTDFDISVSENAVIETVAGTDAIRRIGSAGTGSFTMTGGSITGVLNFGTSNTTVNISGGSLTQSSALNLTTLVGTVENFSNVEFTGSLVAAQGTLTADAVNVTLAASKITLVGGSLSAFAPGSGIAVDMTNTDSSVGFTVNGDLTVDGCEIISSSGPALVFQGANLTVKGGSLIEGTSNYAIRIQTASTVNINGGSVVRSATDGMVRFDASDVTLNVSGAGTTVQNTGTSSAINTNGQTNATINITGATVKSGGVCIYSNGGTVAINVSGDAVLQTSATKNAIERKDSNTTGGVGTITVNGATVTGSIKISELAKLSITDADINGLVTLGNTNSDEIIIKDSKIWMEGDA